MNCTGVNYDNAYSCVLGAQITVGCDGTGVFTTVVHGPFDTEAACAPTCHA